MRQKKNKTKQDRNWKKEKNNVKSSRKLKRVEKSDGKWNEHSSQHPNTYTHTHHKNLANDDNVDKCQTSEKLVIRKQNRRYRRREWSKKNN